MHSSPHTSWWPISQPRKLRLRVEWEIGQARNQNWGWKSGLLCPEARLAAPCQSQRVTCGPCVPHRLSSMPIACIVFGALVCASVLFYYYLITQILTFYSLGNQGLTQNGCSEMLEDIPFAFPFLSLFFLLPSLCPEGMISDDYTCFKKIYCEMKCLHFNPCSLTFF